MDQPPREKREIAHVLEILRRWGIETLGQVAALAKQAVAKGRSVVGLERWDRGKGKEMRLLQLVRPQDSFEDAFQLENEIETSEPLLFILRRSLQQLSLRLDALYLVASDPRLEITFSNKS